MHMAETGAPVRRSPLQHRAPIGGTGVRQAELPFLGKFILRAAPHQAVEPLRRALSLGLPFEPLTSSNSGDMSFLWMGPDEWMLVTPPGDALERSSAARQALAGLHHQLVDVSDYYAVLQIAGENARELLMKLTTLDMHPRTFRAGMVTGSVFGRANAMIWMPVGDDQEMPVANGACRSKCRSKAKC
jgi:heterotetrameric sarcosine oxidase gamma subunit